MSEVQISYVPPEHVRSVWGEVAPLLLDAVDQTDGRYTLDDTYTLVAQHNYILWIAFDGMGIKGAVVTCFLNYPGKKALHIMFLGGVEGRTWETPMLTVLQKFASDSSCHAIEASGGEAWARVLKADGFKPLWNTFELSVTPTREGA